MPRKLTDADRVVMTQIASLSPAERRVFELAVLGLTVREIASRLVVTESTVKSHLAHIYDKCDVRGRIDLLSQVGRSGSSKDAGAIATEIPPNRQRRGLPHLPRAPRWPVVLALVSFVIIAAGLLTGLELPARSISSGELQTLIKAGSVRDLDLTGTTLSATTNGGDRLDVTTPNVKEIRVLAHEKDIPFAMGSSPGSSGLAIVALSMAPYALLLAIGWMFVALFVQGRRNPPARRS